MAKREYIQANKDWLEAKAQEEGVKALPKGIYYKVLAEGNAGSSLPLSIAIQHLSAVDGEIPNSINSRPCPIVVQSFIILQPHKLS